MSDGSGGAELNLGREQRFSSAFQQLIGYRLVEWAADRAVIAYEVMPDHLNRTNRLHGGVIASLLDTAAGYAGCYCATPGETRTTVTLSLTVNFLASASSGLVRIAANAPGAGRRSSSPKPRRSTKRIVSSQGRWARFDTFPRSLSAFRPASDGRPSSRAGSPIGPRCHRVALALSALVGRPRGALTLFRAESATGCSSPRFGYETKYKALAGEGAVAAQRNQSSPQAL